MSRPTVVLLASLMAISSMAVLADDAPSDAPVLTLKQKMQACMAKQKAANGGLSKQDMHKACRNEIQAERDHPSVPATPNNVPPST